MKRLLVILVVLVGIDVNLVADSACRVIGDDQATVVAQIGSVNYSTGEISFSFSSDSEKYVNISYILSANEKSIASQTVVVAPQKSSPFTVTVDPQQLKSKEKKETVKETHRNPYTGNYENTVRTIPSVEYPVTIDVTGARCE